jgi:prepilin-type N-terminal cleavage/methylation domain-containing protein
MSQFSHRSLPGSTPRAFTLVELLVAMTVLTLLVLLVSQMVSATTAVTTGNRERLDADGEARLVLDRMGLDISRMLERSDVDYIFASLPGNDKFFFYSEAPAYFDNSSTIATAQSSLALVGYQINNSSQAPPFQLSRLSKGLTWDESSSSTPGSIVYLTPSSTPSASPTPSPDPNSTLAGHWAATIGTAPDYNGTDTTSYHVIGDAVCRLEICFLLKAVPASGTTAALPAIYSITPYRGSDALHNAVNGMQDVRAIVVTIAVLDPTSRQIAPDLSHISTALRDVTAGDLSASPPVLISKTWQSEIDGGTFAADAQIPKAAAAQVRVYQRHFYLDTN